MEDTTEIKLSPLVQRLNKEKDVAYDFQERRHKQWKENYTLDRDFVETNRLTQRQAINFPIMKETRTTWLSKIDETPSIILDNKDKSDKGSQQEIIANEEWNKDFKDNHLDLLDILEKKIVFLQGRSFKKLNFIDGKFIADVVSPWDILIDPRVNPLDLESARYIIHTHIFKTLRVILADEKYDQEAKENLKKYLQTKEGILRIEETKDSLIEKEDRLKQLGVQNFDEFGASDVVVELNEHYTYLWDEKKDKFVRHLIVKAMNSVILMQKPWKEVMGIDFYPFVTWADDFDLDDMWSDGKGDQVRTPNKVLNVWLSQLIENRTLRNYGMNFYDSSKIGPLQFDPQPFGQYGIPVPEGKTLRDVFQRVDIPNLTETINEMEYVVKIIEKSTGQVAIDKGVSERKQITLGEVQIQVGRSAERAVSTAKMYRPAWIEFAEKWYEIKKANAPSIKKRKLYKKSIEERYWAKEISPKDWISKEGYVFQAISSSEQEENKVIAFQKMQALIGQFPANKTLKKIAERRMLEIGNLTSEEMKSVMDEEEKLAKEIPEEVGEVDRALREQGMRERAPAPATPTPPISPAPVLT